MTAGSGGTGRNPFRSTARTTFLDQSKQIFNCQPRVSEPSTQAASFTTNCDASGCIAHWLLVNTLQDHPNASSLFEYQWAADWWVSSSNYPFHCDDGSTVETTRSDFLVPNGDGKFPRRAHFHGRSTRMSRRRSRNVLAAVYADAHLSAVTA